MKVIGRNLICASAVFLGGALAAATAAPVPELVVFRGGRVELPVIVPADARPEEREAAEELARVLGAMSGLAWPVRIEGVATEGIYVGHTALAGRLAPALRPAADVLAPRAGEIGRDGFRIWSDGGRVFIEGATPEADFFAVSWFLQHYAGVRWYAPGPGGEVVPRREAWTLPPPRTAREPAYVSRGIGGLDSPADRLWARHNGLAQRFEFSHALREVFPAGLARAHPDWFPLVRGKRIQPAGPEDYHWQPNLALPEVAAFAGRAAQAAFARDPARLSFSLGVNDSLRFDQSEATRALVEPQRYFRGRPDYSPLVFTFMNRAAAALDPAENRALGCLAYFWCEDVPPFAVDRRVLPYVTTDRSQYYDARYRAEDLSLMSRWGGSGVKAFGLWEYAYGQSFLVPREPLGAFAESIREGWWRGARGYFADTGPQGGFDAFKIWMIAQLLWEPDRPLAELAGDFFPGYYGAAGPALQRFFADCEHQWMAQSGPPWWIKFYQQEDQALLFPPAVCAALRGLLDEARRAAAGDSVLASRVEPTDAAFAVTENYVAFDAIRRRLAGMVPATVRAEAVGTGVADLLRAEARLSAAWERARSGARPALAQTELSYFVRNDPVPRLLAALATPDAEVPKRILGSLPAALTVPPHWRALAEALADNRVATAPNLTRHADLRAASARRLEPEFLFSRCGELPEGWEVRAVPTENGRVALAAPTTVRPGRNLRVEGAWDTQVYQWLPVEAGRFCIARAQAAGRRSPGNDSGLFLTFLTRDGKLTGTHRMQSLPDGETAPPTELLLADWAPADAAWVGVGVGASRQADGDWFEATDVELRSCGAPALR